MHEKEWVLLYVVYTSVDLTIKWIKQENLDEGRNWDKFNEALNVAFIIGACTEMGKHEFWGHGGTEGQAQSHPK